MSPTARAVADLFLAFGIPAAAVAGGLWLRRGPAPSKAARWGGAVLAGGGVVFLLALGGMILVMKNW